MADRAELVKLLADHIARLRKVDQGEAQPAPADSNVGVLTHEQNEALSLIRILENAGYRFTSAGETVQ